MSHGVHHYPRRRTTDLRTEEKRERERREHDEQVFNDLWRTVPGKDSSRHGPDRAGAARRALLELPQENILYFLEKIAPAAGRPGSASCCASCASSRSISIRRSQTKVMNEGCATYTHYTHHEPAARKGADHRRLDGGVPALATPTWCSSRSSTIRATRGINPYALGFAMMQDIERICTEPTAEDQQWFPAIAGSGDHDERAARRLGQLPRRELHPAVSSARG